MTVWFTARGAGLSALVLLTVTTCLGALGSRSITAPGPRVVLQYVHRVSAALGLGVLALHVGTILADSYAHVGVRGAIVPFTAGYRATWVGLGTISAYLLLAVTATGLARGRLSRTPTGAASWRALHGFAYAAWAFALVHGYESGTDAGQVWVRLLMLVCLLAVPACLLARLAPDQPAASTSTSAAARSAASWRSA